MHLTDLVHLAGLSPTGPIDPGAVVVGVTEDSRRVGPGWVFVARPGLKADGRRFIPDAVGAGAAAVVTDRMPDGGTGPGGAAILLTADPARAGAVLAERLAGSPSARLTLAGVTGTNGKTTIATLICRAAKGAGLACGLIGTVEIDDGTGPVPSDFTTPPAERLSELLARMVGNGCGGAAMEVSSHALDQHRAAGLRFAAGVFTNLTGDHLDYHGDMASYAGAKARLFEGLGGDALAVVNAMDPWTERMTRACGAQILRCALAGAPTPAGPAHATVSAANPTASGMDIRLAGPWGEVVTRTRLVGAHNAMNLLQAACVCVGSLGIEPAQLAEIIPTLAAPCGRLEAVHTEGDDIAVLVDFAHTDDGLANCLRAARLATPAGARLWAIFGCGGNKDRAKRPRMGARAAELADRVIVTSDNPRREDPEAIIDEVFTGIDGAHGGRVGRDADRARAIRAAVAGAEPGDLIVIAGKGHEREQILPDGHGGTRTIPFDDHEIAREALAERRAARVPHGARCAR
ncbi:MAG: UDP-N-acetylmuramoyl-L-alanyl-D-glutamate--2,6-diaminopimelate ligase [Phycisphaerales bacterium]|nr:UDP-N-acetylmuramoyl-L-alanyl-D-glutamate--2,6-diaminopimelate ligase [Phycisphaerales bacterium]